METGSVVCLGGQSRWICLNTPNITDGYGGCPRLSLFQDRTGYVCLGNGWRRALPRTALQLEAPKRSGWWNLDGAFIAIFLIHLLGRRVGSSLRVQCGRPATQGPVPQAEAKIDLALGIQHDGKAWPNSVDPEALKTNLHFQLRATSLRKGSGTAELSLPFSWPLHISAMLAYVHSLQ